MLYSTTQILEQEVGNIRKFQTPSGAVDFVQTRIGKIHNYRNEVPKVEINVGL